MITLAEAKAAGRSDRAEGLTDVELENVAESFIENFGGLTGLRLSEAYRKGAGMESKVVWA